MREVGQGFSLEGEEAWMSWDDGRIERLKKLWSDGLSASQIAAELGGVTRNAVIGKVHRLGLSNREGAAEEAEAAPAAADRAAASARCRGRTAAAGAA
jgi:GcrA cell cycle regulator